MTVAELIKELQKHDQKLPVVVLNVGFGDLCEVVKVIADSDPDEDTYGDWKGKSYVLLLDSTEQEETTAR